MILSFEGSDALHTLVWYFIVRSKFALSSKICCEDVLWTDDILFHILKPMQNVSGYICQSQCMDVNDMNL